MNVYADGRKEFHYGVDNASVSNIPLYESIHDLSDDEIEGAFYKKCWYYDEDEKFDYYGFAKEILKRASKK
jgi:hypothetical protein